MENFALKHNALQQQMQAIIAERNAFLEKIVAAHPGYHWSERDGLVSDKTPPDLRD